MTASRKVYKSVSLLQPICLQSEGNDPKSKHGVDIHCILNPKAHHLQHSNSLGCQEYIYIFLLDVDFVTQFKGHKTEIVEKHDQHVQSHLCGVC